MDHCRRRRHHHNEQANALHQLAIILDGSQTPPPLPLPLPLSLRSSHTLRYVMLCVISTDRGVDQPACCLIQLLVAVLLCDEVGGQLVLTAQAGAGGSGAVGRGQAPCLDEAVFVACLAARWGQCRGEWR